MARVVCRLTFSDDALLRRRMPHLALTLDDINSIATEVYKTVDKVGLKRWLNYHNLPVSAGLHYLSVCKGLH